MTLSESRRDAWNDGSETWRIRYQSCVPLLTVARTTLAACSLVTPNASGLIITLKRHAEERREEEDDALREP
jgi:hypothetical protein